MNYIQLTYLWPAIFVYLTYHKVNIRYPEAKQLSRIQAVLNLAELVLATNMVLLSSNVCSNPRPTSVHNSESTPPNYLNDSSFIYTRQHKRGITIAHLNFRGLCSSLDQLWVFMGKQCLDVLTISKTWLYDNITDEEVDISGYFLIRKDRNYSKGSGVAAYINNKFAFSWRADLESPNAKVVRLDLKLPHSKPLLIGSVYRAPNDDLFFD